MSRLRHIMTRRTFLKAIAASVTVPTIARLIGKTSELRAYHPPAQAEPIGYGQGQYSEGEYPARIYQYLPFVTK